MFPDVYPELQEMSFNGKALIVRNTFVDIEDDTPVTFGRKRHSLPADFFQTMFGERTGHELLSETRGRLLPESRPNSPKSEPAAAEQTTLAGPERQACSSFGVLLDCTLDGSCMRDAVPRAPSLSEASTRTPSPSSLSPRSLSPRSHTPLARDRMQSLFDWSSEGAPEPELYQSSVGAEKPSGQAAASRRHTAEAGETAFMIRGLPHSMGRRELEGLLGTEGFAAAYDFIHLPGDLKVGGSFGYGFVNLVSAGQAQRFLRHFHGFRWPAPGLEPMEVKTSDVQQGLDELIERYRNSPLMHSSVPPGMQPAIYRDGAMVPFPPPTQRLRPPRVRMQKGKMPAGQ